MLALQTILAAACVLAVASGPTRTGTVASCTVCAAAEVALGIVPAAVARAAAVAALPLVPFLAAAVWLGLLAEHAGLDRRIAAALARAARGSAAALYALVVALSVALTATVSLDGAAVLAIPVSLALARRAPWLRRPLVLGTVAAVNASSLVAPQANPANIVVMERAGIGPGAFSARYALPALAATALCAGAVAITGRRRLSRGTGPAPPRPGRWSADERAAALALAAAGAGGVAAPWIGMPAWWPVCIAAAALLIARALTSRRGPWPLPPMRICLVVAALAIVAGAPLSALGGAPPATSLIALLALALATAVLASLAGNLPAGAVLGGVAAAGPGAAGAALAGLSCGALATPHGSVATLIALERAGGGERAGHMRLWPPIALAGVAVATTVAWAV
ncbi:MAG: SLC13 family permease [Thermoleophilia bacterium]